ncbi:MAG: rubrerythrin family protein [Bacilli bacterium]
MTAFAGECKARIKYELFEEIAKKEGYEQIGNIFSETSKNEKEHAEIWLEKLKGLSNTKENLKVAIEGENYENMVMYEEFAMDAKSEGLDDLAMLFKQVGAIEKTHETRFRKLLSNINNDEVFAKDTPQSWVCLNCGYVHYGKEAPKVCPVCDFPIGYFEKQAENY